jgi:hypothetical protein
MRVLKREPAAQQGGFGSPKEGRLPFLSGKKAVFVTDERDLGVESIVTRHILSDAGASQDSRAASYNEFLGEDLRSDILILRSSRIFPFVLERLENALSRFREANPRSAVIVCALDEAVCRRLEPLAQGGVVNRIEPRPGEDRELLLQAERIFGRLQ